MSPKVITFNSKFHQINKLIYVSLFGLKQASHHGERDAVKGAQKHLQLRLNKGKGHHWQTTLAFQRFQKRKKKNIFGTEGSQRAKDDCITSPTTTLN